MVNPLRILFFGTPAFAVPSLTALATSSHTVAGVVTQPDRPKGRGHRVVSSPVKATATTFGLPVFQPERLADPELLAALRALAPDLGVVVAYGRILPVELLSLPRLGMINVHASLLPRWRGAAPVHRAILAGDTTSGVTIMRVVKALDAGPILATQAVAIAPDETSAELEARLAAVGAQHLRAVVDRLADGPIPEIPQDDRLSNYAPRLQRDERQVNWARPAPEIHNQIRGLQPWPMAAAKLGGRRVLLLRSAAVDVPDSGAEPGTILRVEPDALLVAARPGAVRLLAIQPEGRPVMSVRDFLNGHVVVAGERLTSVSAAEA